MSAKSAVAKRRLLSFVFDGLILVLLAACSLGNIIGPGSSTVSGVPVTSQNQWTILVYMNADNDLSNDAFNDLLAMQAANLSGKSIVVLALVDLGAGGNVMSGAWPDARMYRIQYFGGGSSNSTIISERLGWGPLGLTSFGADEDVDMGDPNVLASFIGYAKANYPSRHYALVLWGQASGWRTVGTDSSSSDPLYVQELGQAINGKNLDVIGFDTPSEAMLEVAYQIQTAGRYMVASEGVTTITGWDLQNLLTTFAGSNQGPLDFVSSAVTTFSSAQGSTSRSCISAVDLTMLTPIMTSLNAFSSALYSYINTSTRQISVRQTIFTGVERYYSIPGDMDVDIVDFANVTETPFGMGVFAEALKSAVTGAIVQEWHNSSGHPNSHGLAMHYIPVLSGGTPGALDPEYFQDGTTMYPLSFVANSAWVPVYPNGPGLEYRIWQETITP